MPASTVTQCLSSDWPTACVLVLYLLTAGVSCVRLQDLRLKTGQLSCGSPPRAWERTSTFSVAIFSYTKIFTLLWMTAHKIKYVCFACTCCLQTHPGPARPWPLLECHDNAALWVTTLKSVLTICARTCGLVDWVLNMLTCRSGMAVRSWLESASAHVNSNFCLMFLQAYL